VVQDFVHLQKIAEPEPSQVDVQTATSAKNGPHGLEPASLVLDGKRDNGYMAMNINLRAATVISKDTLYILHSM